METRKTNSVPRGPPCHNPPMVLGQLNLLWSGSRELQTWWMPAHATPCSLNAQSSTSGMWLQVEFQCQTLNVTRAIQKYFPLVMLIMQIAWTSNIHDVIYTQHLCSWLHEQSCCRETLNVGSPLLSWHIIAHIWKRSLKMIFIFLLGTVETLHLPKTVINRNGGQNKWAQTNDNDLSSCSKFFVLLIHVFLIHSPH